MNPGPRFPNSARAAWLRNNQPRPWLRITDEERVRRLLVRELARDLRYASLEQLHLVAQLLGRTRRWLGLARIEALHPGMIGKAILRAAK